MTSMMVMITMIIVVMIPEGAVRVRVPPRHYGSTTIDGKVWFLGHIGTPELYDHHVFIYAVY